MPKVLIVLISVLVVSQLAATSEVRSAGLASSKPIEVKLSAINDSKVDGSAEISQLVVIPENPPAISVTIRLNGIFIPEDKWPSDIHVGSCAHVNPKIAYPLHPVVEGKSETRIQILTVAHFKRAPGYSIEVHNPKDTKVVSCGSIEIEP